MASTVDQIPHAFAGVPCNECDGLGMHPTCVEGACACVDIGQAGALHACDPKMRGRRVSLLQATGHCLATTNTEIKPVTSDTTIDFSTLAVVPCVKGLADNACLGIMLPLSSGIGQFARPLVVVFMDSIHRGRSLLAYAPNDEPREDAYWRLVALQAGLNDTDALQTPFSAARTMLRLAQKNDRAALRLILSHHSGIVMPLLAAAFLPPDAPGNQTTHPPRYADAPRRAIAEEAANHTVKTNSRRLHQAFSLPIRNPFASLTCDALHTPLGELTSVFWITVAYYRNDQQHAPNHSTSFADFLAAAEQIDPAAHNNNNNAGLLGDVADALAGGMGRKLVAAFIAEQKVGAMPSSFFAVHDSLTPFFQHNVDHNHSYVNAHRLIRELSSCNYTALTLAPPAQGGLIYIISAVAVVFTLGTCLCSPPTLFALIIWLIFFPMCVLWIAYGISPLCFPMIPPRMPLDIEAGAQRLLPDPLVRIPRFAVSEDCTLDGRMSDGTFSYGCFKQCTAEPFLMRGWQDTLAWWACEFSPLLGRAIAAAFGVLMPDFRASSAYFAEVIAFNHIDPDFVSAHRICAVAMSHHLLLALFAAAMGLLVLPHAILAMAEICASAATLLVGLSATQALEAEDKDE